MFMLKPLEVGLESPLALKKPLDLLTMKLSSYLISLFHYVYIERRSSSYTSHWCYSPFLKRKTQGEMDKLRIKYKGQLIGNHSPADWLHLPAHCLHEPAD